MPRQEPVQAAEPFTEFWAKATGASKTGNRCLTLFPRFPVSLRPPAEDTGPTEHSCQPKEPTPFLEAWSVRLLARGRRLGHRPESQSGMNPDQRDLGR